MTTLFAGFDGRDRQMLVSLLAMTVRDRFLGSRLGRYWVILNPVLMLSIFSFVFTVVFPQRLPGASTGVAYLIWLISGYGPWLAISEGVMSGAGSVTSSAGIVKNIAFKSELLPVVGALMGLIPLAVSFVFLVVLMAIDGHPPTVAWTWVPVIVLLQFVLVAGVALFLGALAVFVRDIMMILPNVLMVTLFLSPIFFPITAFPKFGQWVSHANPAYILADSYRRAIVDGVAPNLAALGYLTALAAILFLSGLSFFRKLKPYFAARL